MRRRRSAQLDLPRRHRRTALMEVMMVGRLCAGGGSGSGGSASARGSLSARPGNNHGTGCEPVSSALAPPRMVCRRASRGTLQPLFEEPRTWRQQLLHGFSAQSKLCHSAPDAARWPAVLLQHHNPTRPTGHCRHLARRLPEDGSSCELCQTSYPLPALPCISLQPLARYILCCALSGPWPWPGSVPRSRHLSLACLPLLSAYLPSLSLHGCLYYLPLSLGLNQPVVAAPVVFLLLPPMASRESDSPTEADLAYAAAIAERQYKQWKTEQLQPSPATEDARKLSRSRSPPPPSASCRRHLRLLPR